MPPPPSPATAPTLPDELLEEIFLRLPPDDPACLVRASLASKLWLGRLTGAAFRGRYGELHGDPPMLGFLLSYLGRENHPAPHFVSTVKFGARIPDLRQSKYQSLDCRHGRVLLADPGFKKLVVWDPMTGCRRELEAPRECLVLAATVLCAVTGCDHHACHLGPFRVLLFGLHINGSAGGEQRSIHTWVFSSETEEWCQPCSPLQHWSKQAFIVPWPSLLLDNAIYNKVYFLDHLAILKYDIGSNCMSLLDGPPLMGNLRSATLMTIEDDSVGCIYLDCFTLYRWSRQIRSDGVATWTKHTVVDLKQLLPIENPQNTLMLVGFKEGSGIVFLSTDLGIYEININTLELKKLWKKERIYTLIPYMSFYNPPAIPSEEQGHRRSLPKDAIMEEHKAKLRW